MKCRGGFSAQGLSLARSTPSTPSPLVGNTFSESGLSALARGVMEKMNKLEASQEMTMQSLLMRSGQ
eukprot:394759-Pyramimonas_sp.AAC.1